MSELQDVEHEKTSAAPVDENPGDAQKTEPASQALLDLEASGLTPEDMSAAASAAAAEAERKNRPAPPSAALPRFRWLLLLLLSTAGALALAWSGKETPESFLLWSAAGLVCLLLLSSALPPPVRFLPRLPTRGGLAALLFSAAIFIQTLIGGPPKTFFQVCPAPLAWAGLLTLALMWTAVAVVRKLGRCRPLAVLAGLILLHAALGPVPILISFFYPGGLELTWSALNASPAFLTGTLPWFLWPMAFTLGLALPLAALLALGDQFSSLRRPGARHGGNFFLALAWLGLLPSGILLFPPAVDTYPDLVNKIMETAPILSGVEPAIPTIQDETVTSPLDAQTIPKPDAVPAKPAEASPAIPPDDALAAPVPKAAKKPAPSASASPPAADTTEAPPVTVTDDSVASQLEELQSRNENLQLQVDDLESRLQLFSDRLNQLERPEQTPNLTPPLPPDLQAPNNPPDRPSPPEKPLPERRNSYPGGSAT
jgi:hypothetical protein